MSAMDRTRIEQTAQLGRAAASAALGCSESQGSVDIAPETAAPSMAVLLKRLLVPNSGFGPTTGQLRGLLVEEVDVAVAILLLLHRILATPIHGLSFLRSGSAVTAS